MGAYKAYNTEMERYVNNKQVHILWLMSWQYFCFYNSDINLLLTLATACISVNSILKAQVWATSDLVN